MKASKVLAIAFTTLIITGCVSRDMTPPAGVAMAAESADEATPATTAYLLEAHRETVDRMSASSAPHHEPPVACN